jgi:nitrogen fixation NifU-like protein
MTQAVKGRSLAEVEKLFAAFHELVTSSPQREIDESGVGKLAVLAGVREYPVRVKCATLAWHTLRAALAGKHEPVRTE